MTGYRGGAPRPLAARGVDSGGWWAARVAEALVDRACCPRGDSIREPALARRRGFDQDLVMTSDDGTACR